MQALYAEVFSALTRTLSVLNLWEGRAQSIPSAEDIVPVELTSEELSATYVCVMPVGM